ncbi:YcjF family protein [Bradyrhizobium sp. HKCCYLS2038]|uniref:YcjF family protein n=1 Tax=unclassified Bradyrhizobium TaxID=2631580 RepID=UPI003EBB43EB
MSQDANEQGARKPKATVIPPARVTTPAGDSTTASVSDQERDEAAMKLVDRFAMGAGAAALIPVPLLDLAAVGGLQLQMLRKLSDIYGVPYSENRGKSIIASFAGTLIPAGAAPAAAGLLKAIPGVGTAVAAVTMPTLCAGATYTIGRAFIQHFASGGTLLDFTPPDYRQFARTAKDDFSLRRRAGSSARSEA